jgi:peptide/nickel transport system permease protein
MQRLPATFELAVASLIFAVIVAVPLGVIGGMNPGKPVDALVRTVGLAGQTIPTFWLAMLLIIFFAVELRLLPSFGRDSFKSIILPAIALGFGVLGQLVRLTRSAVLEIRSADFVRTAKAKGLRQSLVAARHVLPNVAIPLISVLGIDFTYLLGGSVYIETIFAWPGLGGLLNDAVRDSDFPLVQGITIFISLFAIGIQLLTDILYGWVDPRIRQS